MRNFTRLLTAALFCGALFSAAFVGAQDATATPAGDATMEVSAEPPMEMTAEPTMEVTTEPSMDMTMVPTTESSTSSTDATAMPSMEMTAEATSDMSTGSTTMTTTSGMVTCDSDLILNLYVAERYFGFAGVMDAAMAGNTTGTSTFVDVTTLDKGQYAPVFTTMMSMMDANTMMIPGNLMTQDQITNMGSMMNMDQTDMANQMATMMPPGTDISSMSTLTTGSVAGEPEACTMLRSELNRFYSVLAFNDMQTSMGMSPEATSSADMGSTAANVSFSTTLNGANEVPAADPDGTGTAAVTVDMANGQICYTLSVQNIALPAAAAHIHRGAAGENGGVVVPFDLVPDASGNATSCVKVDAALLTEIATNPAGFYVNVHSSEFPDGAVRGQVSG